MIFWFAPEEPQADYTYEVWPLYGRFADRKTYLLHDEGAVRDWLVLHDDQIHEYDFEGFTNERRQQIRLKSQVSLQQVPRTPQLDTLLRLEPD